MTQVSQIEHSLRQVLEDRATMLARETGCMERQRKFRGADLLHTLVFGWQSHPDARCQVQQRPESQMERSLYDCPEIAVGPEGTLCRVIIATHPAGKKKSPIGVTRAGVVYELFFTNLPQQAFTARDVVELYLHRGAFEAILSDEDRE
jgi:hypothetical protein